MNTLFTKLETFLLDLRDGATATVRFLLRATGKEMTARVKKHLQIN